jgi:hypothetical protein
MNIDHQRAGIILSRAHGDARQDDYVPHSRFSREISRIICGTHKTYKYILINALLAKATNPDVNALVLQAGSSLPGAFDARSLCHKVLVPFERDNLFNSLGGSNEPFLNKPARFPELNKRNAVRRGKDKVILNLLCDLLSKIKSDEESYTCLCDSLYYALKASGDLLTLSDEKVLKTPTYAELSKFIKEFVSESHEGETLALAVGGLFSLLTSIYPSSLKIEVHPVNQCGASSREVSDIDVYLDDKLIYATELKDKDYHSHDVKHAIIKASNICERFIFINGPQGRLVDTTEHEMIDFASSQGVYLAIMSIEQFVTFVLSVMIPIDTKIFYESIRSFALTQKFKTSTIAHLAALAKKHDWI